MERAEASAAPGGIEAKPGGLGDAAGVLDEVFITPRVLDESAFNRFSERLALAVRQTAGAEQRLADAQARTADLVGDATDKGTKLRGTLESVAKVLPKLEERARTLEHAAAQAEAAAERALGDGGAASARIDAMIEGKLRELERRIDEKLAAGEARERDLHASIEKHEHKLDLLERKSTHAEGLVRELQPMATALLARLNETQLEAQAKASEIERTVTPLLERCAGVLGTGDASLEALVERGEGVRDRAEFAAQQLNAMRAIADELRLAIGTDIDAASHKIDDLEQRRARIEAPIGEALASAEAAAPGVIEAVRRAHDELNELRIEHERLVGQLGQTRSAMGQTSAGLQNTADQIKALTDAGLLRINDRVEQAGAWLGQLIKRAESAGGRMGDAGAVPASAQPQPAPAGEATGRPRIKPLATPIDAADFSGASTVIPSPTHGEDARRAG
ncbi:MAG: hypothetical protein AAFP26_07930 [Planctomycetota bacterium]